MNTRFSKLKNHFVNSGDIVTTFLRSSVSSQIASWIDMGIRVLFFTFVFAGLSHVYRSNLSVAVGAIVGGIVNCCINYKFTFHATGVAVKAVAVKYLLVWVGSLLLNMYGTTYVALAMSHWQWLISIGFKPSGIFAASTLAVSLIVSLAWNFVLQKNFVYRTTAFDPAAIRIVNFLIRHKNKPQEQGNQ